MSWNPDTDPPPTRGLERLGGQIVTAMRFMTRLPLRRRAAPESKGELAKGELARAAWAMPLTGLAVGALSALAMTAAIAFGLPQVFAALIAVAAAMLLTGGLHEDGLADWADSFGGGDRKRRLEIMRDSRIGSFGVMALILAFAVRLAALASLPLTLAAPALIVAGAASRALLPSLMRRLSPAREDGLAASAGRPDGAGERVAWLIGAAPALLLLPLTPAVLALAGVVVGTGLVGWWAKSRLGGLTGDLIGAAQVIGEIGFWLVLVAALG